jgi:hypothetical protein
VEALSSNAFLSSSLSSSKAAQGLRSFNACSIGFAELKYADEIIKPVADTSETRSSCRETSSPSPSSACICRVVESRICAVVGRELKDSGTGANALMRRVRFFTSSTPRRSFSDRSCRSNSDCSSPSRGVGRGREGWVPASDRSSAEFRKRTLLEMRTVSERLLGCNVRGFEMIESTGTSASLRWLFLSKHFVGDPQLLYKRGRVPTCGSSSTLLGRLGLLLTHQHCSMWSVYK